MTIIPNIPTESRRKAYEEQRNSGVEWLGMIPAQWSVVRSKYLLKEIDERTETGTETLLSLSKSRGLIPRSEITDRPAGAATLIGYKVCRPADIVMNKMQAWNGMFGFSRYHGLVSPDYAVFRPSTILDARYFSYLFTTALYVSQFHWRSRGMGTGFLRLHPSVFSDVETLTPPALEQRAIANFLDRETARIDALIAKKERLIELLQEKRTALISHAVTKGLDPTVPMKDSGIPWIGDVPAHWDVRRLKTLAKLESGHTPSRSVPEYWENCTIPWVSLSDVGQLRDGTVDVITQTSEKVSELGLANSSARLLPKDTVILSRTASVGFSALLGQPMATTQDFANWICGKDLQPHYLLQVFRAMKPEFDRLVLGSTHKTIYMPEVAEFVTPHPPLEEQSQITEHIAFETRRIDTLTSKIWNHIDLLREHRTALISAAVTGKIDVRGEV